MVPMFPVKKEHDHPVLEQVQELFARWRKNKRRRDPIPSALWEAAISLVGHYSIHKIARYLHLGYNELKVRARGCSAVPARTGNSSAFIELNPLAVTVTCTVEMTKPTGERMRITGNCNAVELAREFWGR